jgi:hypothetical protein
MGVYVISSFKVDPTLNPVVGVVEGLGILYIVPVLYVALILILLIVSLKIIFGITNILRTSRRAYQKIKYSGLV